MTAPMTALNIDELHQTARELRTLIPQAAPRVVMVLGSGWGDVAELCNVRRELSYEKLPALGRTSVPGHSGRMLWGEIQGVEAFVFQGRRHYYEGCGWTPIATPLFLARTCGAAAAVITNAVGCLENSWKPGELMVVEDHINLMGSHPLIGPHLPDFGPRFFDVSTLYSPDLRASFLKCAAAQGFQVRTGVLAAMSGPTYESPAEIRMLKTLGASAVGMSLVPEALLAHGLGLEVLGISCLTNMAAGMGIEPLTHLEVTQTMHSVMPSLRALFERFFRDTPFPRQS